MFLATFVLLIGFRHTTPVSRSSVSLVPVAHIRIGPIPFKILGKTPNLKMELNLIIGYIFVLNHVIIAELAVM